MTAIFLRVGIRLVLCAGISWIVWRWMGTAALVVTAPLYGIALAKPLIDLASDLRHHTRAAVWRPLEGRHFVFRGLPLQVLEDADHRRWIRAADVRRILGGTTSDGALALTYPKGWQAMGKAREPHFSDEALIAHLSKETSPEGLRFLHWAEREIAFPAQRLRKRFGIRPEAPDFVASD